MVEYVVDFLTFRNKRWCVKKCQCEKLGTDFFESKNISVYFSQSATTKADIGMNVLTENKRQSEPLRP